MNLIKTNQNTINGGLNKNYISFKLKNQNLTILSVIKFKY